MTTEYYQVENPQGELFAGEATLSPPPRRGKRHTKKSRTKPEFRTDAEELDGLIDGDVEWPPLKVCLLLPAQSPVAHKSKGRIFQIGSI